MIALNRCPPGRAQRSSCQRHSPRSAGTCLPFRRPTSTNDRWIPVKADRSTCRVPFPFGWLLLQLLPSLSGNDGDSRSSRTAQLENRVRELERENTALLGRFRVERRAERWGSSVMAGAEVVGESALGYGQSGAGVSKVAEVCCAWFVTSYWVCARKAGRSLPSDAKRMRAPR